MARPRSFDEEAALTGAMRVFRRLGFAATSIRDLEQATALSAGSIYNSFGDKGGLFDAAFAHYLAVVLRGRLKTYAVESDGLEGVRALFISLLEEPDGKQYGCLITNSAIEFGVGDEARQRAVTSGFEILRTALLDRLSAARDSGLLRKDVAPALAAVKLVALYQGVLVLVRAGYKKRSVRQAIELEFDMLVSR
ncbi:MAG TPA: TetR/AcrR family transcriptional regulator [Burkholderiaceae bacterium]|nr:TetR/AcrR family transcriptional regulator [Burkholderiaceae bacterium]